MVPSCWRAVVITGASGQTTVASYSSWKNTNTAVNICVIVGLHYLIQGKDQASLQQDEQHNNADNQGRSSSLISVYPGKDRSSVRKAPGNNKEESWEMGRENLHHNMLCRDGTQGGQSRAPEQEQVLLFKTYSKMFQRK